jgi:heme exporter protein D
MVITLEMGGSVFFLWDVVVLGLVPFMVKHEDIRLVSIKD